MVRISSLLIFGTIVVSCANAYNITTVNQVKSIYSTYCPESGTNTNKLTTLTMSGVATSFTTVCPITDGKTSNSAANTPATTSAASTSSISGPPDVTYDSDNTIYETKFVTVSHDTNGDIETVTDIKTGFTTVCPESTNVPVSSSAAAVSSSDTPRSSYTPAQVPFLNATSTFVPSSSTSTLLLQNSTSHVVVPTTSIASHSTLVQVTSSSYTASAARSVSLMKNAANYPGAPVLALVMIPLAYFF